MLKPSKEVMTKVFNPSQMKKKSKAALGIGNKNTNQKKPFGKRGD